MENTWTRFRTVYKRVQEPPPSGTRVSRISLIREKVGIRHDTKLEDVNRDVVTNDEAEEMALRIYNCANTQGRLHEDELKELTGERHPLVAVLAFFVKFANISALAKAESAIALARLQDREHLDDTFFGPEVSIVERTQPRPAFAAVSEVFDTDPVVIYLVMWAGSVSGAERVERTEAVLCCLAQICEMLSPTPRGTLVNFAIAVSNKPEPTVEGWEEPSAHTLDIAAKLGTRLGIQIVRKAY